MSYCVEYRHYNNANPDCSSAGCSYFASKEEALEYASTYAASLNIPATTPLERRGELARFERTEPWPQPKQRLGCQCHCHKPRYQPTPRPTPGRIPSRRNAMYAHHYIITVTPQSDC